MYEQHLHEDNFKRQHFEVLNSIVLFSSNSVHWPAYSYKKNTIANGGEICRYSCSVRIAKDTAMSNAIVSLRKI
jgi:hypothetical protein